MRTVTPALAIALACLLSACSIVPPAQEVDIYPLPASRLARQPIAVDAQLMVAAVDSGEAINSRRILVTDDGLSLQALPGGRWSSPVRYLLRDRLVESLRADGRIAAVSGDAASQHASLVLHTSLREFAGDLSGQPAASIRLDASLTDAATRRIIASREFRVRTASAGASASQLVPAFAEATDQLALALAQWIDESLASGTEREAE